MQNTEDLADPMSAMMSVGCFGILAVIGLVILIIGGAIAWSIYSKAASKRQIAEIEAKVAARPRD